jgi:hypothetical protein
MSWQIRSARFSDWLLKPFDKPVETGSTSGYGRVNPAVKRLVVTLRGSRLKTAKTVSRRRTIECRAGHRGRLGTKSVCKP